MAFWIDDQPGHAAAGLHWRDIPELGLNKAFLQHYIEPGDTDVSNRAWFDNVVVSTERIGCAPVGPDPDPTGSGSDGTSTSGPDDPTTSGPASTSTSGGDSTGSSGGGGPVTTGAGSSAGDTSSDGSATGAGASDSGGPGASAPDEGCGCRTADDRPDGHAATGLALALAGVLIRRRRRR
nr:MYXO-CTERM sorting domain-containing protein [Nannocystis pusilla]